MAGGVRAATNASGPLRIGLMLRGIDEYDGAGKCIVTGETVDRRVVVAKSY